MRNTIYFDSFFLNQVIARKVDLSRKRELARVKLARKFKPHFFFFYALIFFFLIELPFSSLNRDSLRTPSLALSKKANFLLFSSRSNFSNHLFIPDLFSCLLITASRFLVTTVCSGSRALLLESALQPLQENENQGTNGLCKIFHPVFCSPSH